MFKLLIVFAVTSSPVDEYCRSKFGHPGNLGATEIAAKYFTDATTYQEAVATIGEMGQELASIGNSKVYLWRDGKLEMHFHRNRLVAYRLNGDLKTPIRSAKSFRERSAIATTKKTQAEKYKKGTHDLDRRFEHEAFQRRVQEIIQTGRQVMENSQERTDIRTLEFLLPKLNEAIARKQWSRADEVRGQMRVSLIRAQGVAADAQRRIAARKRADEERRHREEMRQRERQHQEMMNALRSRWY